MKTLIERIDEYLNQDVTGKTIQQIDQEIIDLCTKYQQDLERSIRPYHEIKSDGSKHYHMNVEPGNIG